MGRGLSRGRIRILCPPDSKNVLWASGAKVCVDFLGGKVPRKRRGTINSASVRTISLYEGPATLHIYIVGFE